MLSIAQAIIGVAALGCGTYLMLNGMKGWGIALIVFVFYAMSSKEG